MMKLILILVVIIFFVILLKLVIPTITNGDCKGELRGLRRPTVSLLILAVVIVVLLLCNKTTTEMTKTVLPLAPYVEDGKPEAPLGYYIKVIHGTTDQDSYARFCYHDAEAEKVLKGKIQLGEMEYIINPNVANPSVTVLEHKVTHRITGEYEVFSYFIFTVPSEDSIFEAEANIN